MAEWPQVMMTCSECGNQLRRCSCRPADWYPEEPPVIKETVVPADLARELYEAVEVLMGEAVDILTWLDSKNIYPFVAADLREVVSDTRPVLARYEQECHDD